MNVLFVKPDDTILSKWKSTHQLDDDEQNLIVKIGDPITLEYKRIKIVSNKFDIFGSDEIMIVNYIKSVQTKEISLQSITYYDDDAKTTKITHELRPKRSYTVGPFSADEYGNPIFYHSPSYTNNTITITTKFWEINSSELINTCINLLRKVVSLGAAASPYLEIADAGLGICSTILTDTIHHKLLTDEHVIEFNPNSSYPILEGTYVCFPMLNDINERNYIISNYSLIDGILVKIIKPADDNQQAYPTYKEYDGNYFIFTLNRAERPDLAHFDFIASSADLLSKLKSGVKDTQTILTSLNKSFEMEIIDKYNYYYKKYLEDNNNYNKLMANAYFKQLSDSSQKLLLNQHNQINPNQQI